MLLPEHALCCFKCAGAEFYVVLPEMLDVELQHNGEKLTLALTCTNPACGAVIRRTEVIVDGTIRPVE